MSKKKQRKRYIKRRTLSAVSTTQMQQHSDARQDRKRGRDEDGSGVEDEYVIDEVVVSIAVSVLLEFFIVKHDAGGSCGLDCNFASEGQGCDCGYGETLLRNDEKID